MNFAKQTTSLAAALVVTATFSLSTTANAQSRYFDKLEGKNMGEIRTEVDKRLKRFSEGSTDESVDTLNSNNTTIKIDRAGIRSMIDSYLPK